MSAFVSLHGRRVGFNDSGLLFDDRPVGGFLPRGPKGKVFFVDSAVDGTAGTSPSSAVGTLDEAFALCTANQGDTIYVMPNHAETVTGAGGITHDVAGVSVIGLGSYNNRPRILLDGGTAVTYLISAADAWVENLELAAGHASVVTCFDVTAVGATIKNIEFTDNTTSEFFLVSIKASGADNTADGLSVIGCKRVTAEAATDFISCIGNVNKLTVADNFYSADAATGAGLILCATGKVLTGLECIRNVLIVGNTASDILIDNDANTNTGYAAWNLSGHHDTAAVVNIDCDGIRQFQNYSVGSDTESGVLMPAADTLT